MQQRNETRTGLPILAPEALSKWLRILFASYRTPLSDDAATGYAISLADLTESELGLAFSESLRRHDSNFPPTPAEVRGYLYAALEQMPRPREARDDCKNCDGTGWRVMEHKGTKYAVDCNCRRRIA